MVSGSFECFAAARNRRTPGIKEWEQEAAWLETGTHPVIDSSGIPVSAPRVALDKTAELSAAVRTAGLTTAHPAALDGDAILAAQTILGTDAGDVVTIATNNARHLSRFPGIDARHWSSITP